MDTPIYPDVITTHCMSVSKSYVPHIYIYTFAMYPQILKIKKIKQEIHFGYHFTEKNEIQLSL